jgi:AcrR family transcriptional regulator
MDAARRLFADQGYEAVSMRRIADAIEYSPTAIYDHFEDKAALLREICHEDFAALAGVFNELAAIEDPVQRIVGIGGAYVRFAVAYPNHYRLMFMTPRPMVDLDEQTLSLKGRPEADAYAFLRTAVTQAIALRRVRPGVPADAELLTQTLWAGVHGVASIEITHNCEKWVELRPLEERARLMIETACEGLFAPTPASNKGENAHHARHKRKAGSR